MSDAPPKVPTFEERVAGAEACTTPDARRDFIAHLMAQDLWPSYPESVRFRTLLQAAWGVGDSSVRKYAAEAHRLLAFSPDERDQMRAELARRFAGYAQVAMANRNNVTGLPDIPSAIKATELVGKYLGLEPETKIQHGGSIALDTLDDLRERMAQVSSAEAVDGDAQGRDRSAG